jgi:hypothetical protein
MGAWKRESDEAAGVLPVRGAMTRKLCASAWRGRKEALGAQVARSFSAFYFGQADGCQSEIRFLNRP